MSKPIKAKINVTKILKQHLFQGKSGTYLDIVIWPNKEASQYGHTHVIKQSLPKEARDAGEKEPIIGNLTMPDDELPPRQQQRPATRPKPPVDPDLDADSDPIPF